MKNAHYLVVGLLLFLAMQACTERMICPAYQSAFIHDKDALDRHFSYFKEDSTPKILSASKDRFNIIEPVAYRKKLRSLQTIAMVDVYPQEDDSLAFDDEIELAERDYGYDSTAVISEDTVATAADSIYMISLKKENFNVDQELYLWYLKDFLVYPDVRLQMEENAEVAAAEEKKKKGISGFFKRLFGGKKNKSDTTGVETSATELNGEEEPKKRGIFGFLKKGKKDQQEEEDTENNEEATEEETEEEDDF
ncbi:MAG: hypothetical protein ABJH05_09460 [Fulvivirga sp.]